MAKQESPQETAETENLKQTGKSRKKINLRLIIQIFFFTLIALIAVNHALEEQGKAIWFLSSATF